MHSGDDDQFVVILTLCLLTSTNYSWPYFSICNISKGLHVQITWIGLGYNPQTLDYQLTPLETVMGTNERDGTNESPYSKNKSLSWENYGVQSSFVHVIFVLKTLEIPITMQWQG